MSSGRVKAYDVAVRMRPDLYHRKNFRRNRGTGSLYRGVPMNQICTVPKAAWPIIVADAERCGNCVRGCDDDTTPGNKSGDMCFWSSPPTALDRLVDAWDGIADEFLDANLCWQEWRALGRRLVQHRKQQFNRAAVPAPPTVAPTCLHPETNVNPSPAELILVAAAARERLARSSLRSTSSDAVARIARTAKCT